jgi:uncharacterized protein
METTEPREVARRRRLRYVIYGPSGLRAGWRVLCFLLFCVAVESLAGSVLKAEHELFGAVETPGGVLFEKAALLLCLCVFTLIAGALEHRTLSDYGLPLRKTCLKQLCVGALWGFGILSANIALMVLLHAYSFGRVVLPPVRILTYASAWAAADLATAIAEEFGLRGYLQYTLTCGIGFWPAAVVTSILFGLAHLGTPGETWQDITNIAILALFLCMALRRTGNLWFAIGSHAAWDWGLVFFYSAGDASPHQSLFHASMHGTPWLTGGAAGPEGNILNVILVGAAILLLSRVYPHAQYPTAVTGGADSKRP